MHVLRDGGFDVVGTAADARDLVRMASAYRPDVIVADIQMPPDHSDDGLRAALQIRAAWPGIGVLVLSQFLADSYAFDLVADGAQGVGYILKEKVGDLGMFTDAVRRVAGGGSVLDPDVVAWLGRPAHRGLGLTRGRGREILSPGTEVRPIGAGARPGQAGPTRSQVDDRNRVYRGPEDVQLRAVPGAAAKGLTDSERPANSSRSTEPTRLRGRRSECAVLSGLLAGVRGGRSAVLAMRGEAGIGKTALLEYVVQAAADLPVLRAAGVESEMELAFAALHQLCGPALDRLGRLAGPQRDALGTAFGLTEGPEPDRFLVGLAVLGLLSEVAAERPLVCVIDDAQWLDLASAQALAFAARRLLAESVLVVFATREPNADFCGLPELVVDGLRDSDARELLASVLRWSLDEQVRDRIVAETRGNPSALLELPRGLCPAQLAGGFGAPGVARRPGPIEESFLHRVQGLPEEARRLLVVAAAEPAGDPALMWRAAGRLGIPVAAGTLAAEEWANATLNNGLGRYDEALAAAEQGSGYPHELGMASWSMVELIEAAARAGRPGRGAGALRRLSEITTASGTDWALGVQARCRRCWPPASPPSGCTWRRSNDSAAPASEWSWPAHICCTASGCGARTAAWTPAGSSASPTRC